MFFFSAVLLIGIIARLFFPVLPLCRFKLFLIVANMFSATLPLIDAHSLALLSSIAASVVAALKPVTIPILMPILLLVLCLMVIPLVLLSITQEKY